MWLLKHILLFLACVFLMFLGIPVRIKTNDEVQFEKFLETYNKSYPNDSVYQSRFRAFKDSLEIINRLNALRTSESSALYGITAFSDMPQDEFVQKHLLKNYMKRRKLSKSRRARRNTKQFSRINKEKENDFERNKDVASKKSNYLHNVRFESQKYKDDQMLLETSTVGREDLRMIKTKINLTDYNDLNYENNPDQKEVEKNIEENAIHSKQLNNSNDSNNKVTSEDIFENVLYVGNIADALKNNDIRKRLNLPSKIDWREKGAVTEVNNQHGCGACWAFSVVEMIESINAISGNVLEKLSAQELIDCARNGNRGCNGGYVCSTLEWLMDEKVPLMPETAYPLHLKTERCTLNKTGNGVRIKNYTCDSFAYDEEYLLMTLANHGPVAVVINAMLWQYYLEGVIHYHCSSEEQHLNHAAEIVGYNLNADIPYYIVRNSWGVGFGDRGYLHIEIGSNMCGLANEVAFVDV